MLIEGAVVHANATIGWGPGGKFSAFNIGPPTVYRNVTLVIVKPPLLPGMFASLSNSSAGQKLVLELAVQEYPAWGENATIIGSDAGEVDEDAGTGAADMLPPPQALHPNISAKTMPPAEIFTELPPQRSSCKADAIVKHKRSSRLARGRRPGSAIVEDVCHFFFNPIKCRQITSGNYERPGQFLQIALIFGLGMVEWRSLPCCDLPTISRVWAKYCLFAAGLT